MRKTLLIVVLLFAALATVQARASFPLAEVSLESLSGASGIIRVMAYDGNGQPASGQTVVVLHDPCQSGNYVIGDAEIDYSQVQPGQSEEGAFFPFTIPTPQCRGRYTVNATIYAGSTTIFGSTSFKY